MAIKTISNRHYDSRYPSFLFINKTFYKSNAILIDNPIQMYVPISLMVRLSPCI